MLLNWKNQYYASDYTAQSNLQIWCNPYQITNSIFRDLEQKFSQFVWKHKRSWIVKAILRTRNRAGGINLPEFRLYSKDTVIKTVWYWHKRKYRPMEQDRKPRDKSMHLWVPYLWQRRQEYTMEKRQWCWGNWAATCKRMKLEHFLTPYTKINSKRIKDLNVIPECTSSEGKI